MTMLWIYFDIFLLNISITRLSGCRNVRSNDRSTGICRWIWDERTSSISLCIGDDVRELEAPLQMVAYALICQHQEIEQELQNRIPMKCVFKHKDTTIHIITKKEDWMNVSAILHCQSLYVYKQVLHCLQLEKTRDFFLLYFINFDTEQGALFYKCFQLFLYWLLYQYIICNQYIKIWIH